jgi:hypothetical protein
VAKRLEQIFSIEKVCSSLFPTFFHKVGNIYEEKKEKKK